MPTRYGRFALVGLVLLGGCQGTHRRGAKEHASSVLLDSGPQPQVSKRESADMHVALGRSIEEQGRPEEARAPYIQALKADPKRADAELRLAILDDMKGDQTGADRHFGRALKLKPKDPEILCDRGYSLYLRRRWSDSEACLKQALAIDPAHARSHTNLGLVLARRGDGPAALAEFARAGCDPADARSNLALVMALEGRLEDSRAEYAMALSAKPGSSPAKEGLRATGLILARHPEARRPAAGGQADPALVRTSNP